MIFRWVEQEEAEEWLSITAVIVLSWVKKKRHFSIYKTKRI